MPDSARIVQRLLVVGLQILLILHEEQSFYNYLLFHYFIFHRDG